MTTRADHVDDLTAEIVGGLDLVPIPTTRPPAQRRQCRSRARVDLAMVTFVVLVGLITATVALAVRSARDPIDRELVPAGTGSPAVQSARELTAEGMSREVSSWRWLPGAASGSWSRNVFGDPSGIGDELILVRVPPAGRNLRRAIWISLDSRIPEPDCEVGTPATARELATWIGSRSWLSATPPRRVTLEGIDALEIDITAVPGEDPPARCPLGDIYSRANGRFFIEVREAGTKRHPWVVEPGETIRLLLFDRFTGSAAPRTIGVTIQSPTESFDAMVADATPIVRALLSTLVAYPD